MADVYRSVKEVFDGYESYAVASGVETGSMMQWDTGARVATPMTTASGAIFLGVSEESNPLNGLGTTAVPLTGNVSRIKSQGIFNMKTTSGETYSHLDAVFMGADDQTVTKVGSGRMVGRIHLPGGSQVSGSSTTKVPVRILGSMTNCGIAPSSAPGAR